MFSKFVTGLVLFATAMFTVAQSPFNNTIYPAVLMTATSQTSAPLGLQGFSGGAVTLKGTSLTTATIGVLGSADGGLTYFAIPLCTVAVTPVCANTQTATANAMYQVNLVALTNIEFVTSGTFTATSISLTLAASANAQLSKAAAASGGTIPSTTNVLAGDGAGNAADSGLATSNISTLSGTQTVTGAKSFTHAPSSTVPGTLFSSTGGSNLAPNVYIDGSPGTTQPTFSTNGSGLVIHGPGSSFYTSLQIFEGTTAVFTIFNGNVSMATGNVSTGGTYQGASYIATAAASSASAGQISYGGTTAASSNCGTLAGASACIQINVAGTTRYIPIY